jgi:hypothetical protein
MHGVIAIEQSVSYRPTAEERRDAVWFLCCSVHNLVLRLFRFGINITELNTSGIRKDWRIKCSGTLRRVADVWKGRSVLIFTVRQSKPIVINSKRRHIFASRYSVTSQMVWNFATPLWAPKICRTTQHIVCTVNVHSCTSFFFCQVFVAVTNCAGNFCKGSRLRSIMLTL